jgi:hypothetical protein
MILIWYAISPSKIRCVKLTQNKRHMIAVSKEFYQSSDTNQSPTDHWGQFDKQTAHAKLQLKVWPNLQLSEISFCCATRVRFKFTHPFSAATLN